MIFLLYGYGSIPINTIFRGMNIHKSQLFWGEQKVPGFWPIPICCCITLEFISLLSIIVLSILEPLVIHGLYKFRVTQMQWIWDTLGTPTRSLTWYNDTFTFGFVANLLPTQKRIQNLYQHFLKWNFSGISALDTASWHPPNSASPWATGHRWPRPVDGTAPSKVLQERTMVWTV